MGMSNFWKFDLNPVLKQRLQFIYRVLGQYELLWNIDVDIDVHVDRLGGLAWH